MRNIFKLFALFLLLFATVHTLRADDREARDVKVDAFTTLKIGSAFKVYIKQGDTHSLKIVASQEDHENIIVENSGGRLRIRYDQDFGKWKNNKEEMTLYIEFKELEELDVSGACSLEGENVIRGKEMEIEASGASTVLLDIETERLKVDLSGASKLELGGTATEQEVEASGASNYRAYDLQSKAADLRASGASNLRVNVSEDFKAKASGASNIRYRGEPARFHANSSTAASVRQN